MFEDDYDDDFQMPYVTEGGRYKTPEYDMEDNDEDWQMPYVPEEI